MPFYQFACRECGQDFERKLRMAQSDETQVCPECGSADTRKRIGSFAVAGTSSAPRRSSPPPASPFS
jgi:putative FmdB family regulatory protein